MKKYESVIIVKPNLSKNKFDEISKKIDNKMNEVAKNINKQDYLFLINDVIVRLQDRTLTYN